MQYTFADPPPYQHQLDAVQKMIATKGVTALLMDPGTGKTRSTIDYLSILAVGLSKPVKVLVAGPVSCLDTWIEQSGQYAPGTDTPNPVAVHGEVLEGSIEQRAARLASFADGRMPGDDEKAAERIRRTVPSNSGIHLAVTNLEAFSQKHAAKGPDGQPLKTVTVLDRMIDAVRAWSPDVIVVDESHRIKSTTSNVSLAFARMRNLAPRRIVLTGTVMPHSPMDVYGQWRFLSPGALSDRSGSKSWNASDFRERFAIMGGWMGKEITGWQNLDELEERMAVNAIVVKKRDALDLPKVTKNYVHVHLSPREEKAYREMKRDMAIRFRADTDGGSSVAVAQNKLVRMLRLRQITSGYVPDEDGKVRRVGSSKLKVAASLSYDLMQSEDRLVVFAHFKDEIAQTVEALQKRLGKDVTVEVITGDTKQSERTKIKRRFGDVEGHPGKIVLVCQMRTMSLAVNELVTASHAIYMSMSERRDDFIQSMDRLDRIGQKNPVTFHLLVVPGTVDPLIIDAHEGRSDLEETVLAHIREEDN